MPKHLKRAAFAKCPSWEEFCAWVDDVGGQLKAEELTGISQTVLSRYKVRDARPTADRAEILEAKSGGRIRKTGWLSVAELRAAKRSSRSTRAA